MAFKRESDDKRDSLSYKLKKLFEVESNEVLCTDPYVPDAEFVSLEEAVQEADIVVLGAPHEMYRHLRIPPDKVIVDMWNLWPQRRQVPATKAAGAKG